MFYQITLMHFILILWLDRKSNKSGHEYVNTEQKSPKEIQSQKNNGSKIYLIVSISHNFLIFLIFEKIKVSLNSRLLFHFHRILCEMETTAWNLKNKTGI